METQPSKDIHLRVGQQQVSLITSGSEDPVLCNSGLHAPEVMPQHDVSSKNKHCR